jgi:hypothetical protein
MEDSSSTKDLSSVESKSKSIISSVEENNITQLVKELESQGLTLGEFINCLKRGLNAPLGGLGGNAI